MGWDEEFAKWSPRDPVIVCRIFNARISDFRLGCDFSACALCGVKIRAFAATIEAAKNNPRVHLICPPCLEKVKAVPNTETEHHGTILDNILPAELGGADVFLTCDDCGAKFGISKGMILSEAFMLFTASGHWGNLTLTCGRCGETQTSGYDSDEDPVDNAIKTKRWYDLHKNCERMVN